MLVQAWRHEEVEVVGGILASPSRKCRIWRAARSANRGREGSYRKHSLNNSVRAWKESNPFSLLSLLYRSCFLIISSKSTQLWSLTKSRFTSNLGIWVSGRGSVSSEPDYETVESHINELEVKRLIAVEHSEGTAKIDKELAQLRSRLEKLRPSHDAAMQRAAEEAKRAADEAEKRKMKQYEEEQVAFQKRCEAARSKRIADLTVNDLEVLKACGTNIQGLPQIR